MNYAQTPEYKAEYYKKNRKRFEERFLKNKYGITFDVYNQMFAEQEGKCKICNKHQSNFKNRLSIDHCHRTGKIRGLLCHNCNLAIGRLYEDPKIIAAALEYVSLSVPS